MGAPKSVVKLSKNGVTYTSNVEYAEWTMKELCRAALRDVARFVRRKFGEEYYHQLHRHSGEGRKAISAKVLASESTKYPRVDIGIRHAAPGKPVPGFYTYFHEVGTSKHKKLGILARVVESNIPQIVEIESRYLTALEDEAKALALIGSEDDMEVEDDG